MAQVDGASLLVKALKDYGVDHIFTLHGVHIDPILQSCIDHDITLVDTRHEAAAGHAAEGYCRARAGTPAVCVVTAGPGFANVLTSMVNAYLDCLPVLYIAGAPPRADTQTNPLQGGFDQAAMAAPVSKWSHRVARAEEIPGFVHHAWRLMRSGRPGPVFLEIPMDVVFGTIDESAVSPAPPAPERPAPGARDEEIGHILEILSRAERPAIMAGGGVWWAQAHDRLRRFVEHSGIPVFANSRGHGVVPGNHPLYGGWFTNLAVLKRERDLAPDAILMIGARQGLFAGGTSNNVIPGDARLIHIDIDGAELGRLHDAQIAIAADCATVLEQLNAAAADLTWPDRSRWQQAVGDNRRWHAQSYAEELNREQPPIHPYQAIRVFLDVVDDDVIIAADGAECFHWLELMAELDNPGSFLAPGYLGCLGTGLPFAIGAKIACPQRQVVCLAGDGAVGLNITEFHTMARLNLPITTLVINNRSWGASLHGQAAFYGDNRTVATELGHVDYQTTAAGFGCHGEYVERIEELLPALQRALESNKPACVNVMTDAGAVAPDVAMLIQALNEQWYGGRGSR